MAWSDEARAAALEARRASAKAKKPARDIPEGKEAAHKAAAEAHAKAAEAHSRMIANAYENGDHDKSQSLRTAVEHHEAMAKLHSEKAQANAISKTESGLSNKQTAKNASDHAQTMTKQAMKDGTKQSHVDAIEAHSHAATMQRAAGNEKAAKLHEKIEQSHRDAIGYGPRSLAVEAKGRSVREQVKDAVREHHELGEESKMTFGAYRPNERQQANAAAEGRMRSAMASTGQSAQHAAEMEHRAGRANDPTASKGEHQLASERASKATEEARKDARGKDYHQQNEEKHEDAAAAHFEAAQAHREHEDDQARGTKQNSFYGGKVEHHMKMAENHVRQAQKIRDAKEAKRSHEEAMKAPKGVGKYWNS